MKKAWRVMAVLAAILLLGGFWVFHQASSTATSSVSLFLVTNAVNPSPGGMVYRITNADQRAILLTDLIVETNSPTGWKAFSHTIPAHPQRLATGDTKDLIIAAPDTDKSWESWRLRVTFGKDIKGPMLFLGKAEYAIFHGGWPGQGFGIMAGSNSCVSSKMAR